eukprot:CAMPEP_0172450812 /NCGR_PEP_ID=MMETSP1065-20121228/9038_1 /TAXON_ID=265537 /ORGANISM="Amphiprora paludosa, Strain CCMP125" /LENGTH=139 /DNA_ID=CAMNT_0013202649 /DNA_START=126 /DNA_END=545 /DNA_ORIENTATION=-
MPTILLKKTFKTKKFAASNEKAFTLHGPTITAGMIVALNDRLATQVHHTGSAQVLRFDILDGHYYAAMNHDYQKYHEEDAVAVICDCMEEMGWFFKFQYDSTIRSDKASGSSSTTNREIMVFHKPIERLLPEGETTLYS